MKKEIIMTIGLYSAVIVAFALLQQVGQPTRLAEESKLERKAAADNTDWSGWYKVTNGSNEGSVSLYMIPNSQGKVYAIFLMMVHDGTGMTVYKGIGVRKENNLSISLQSLVSDTRSQTAQVMTYENGQFTGIFVSDDGGMGKEKWTPRR